MPITWEEPFGLVMPEAMACGTPVIAFRRGSAPELIRHGQTGFIVDTVEEMADAVGDLGRIDPWACRSHVRTNFSPGSMMEGYLRLYGRILEQRRFDIEIPSDAAHNERAPRDARDGALAVA